jgi:5-dehydro-2-deoxygluconokinase
LEKLKTITDFCRVKGFKFLLEVLVIPTHEQLQSFNNSKAEFDSKMRPGLTVEVIKEFYQHKVEPDVWKLEGFDTKAEYRQVIDAAREGGRSSVSLVILGRGESEEKVDEWLSVGKDVVGVIGFAVGRTVFWQAILDFRKGIKSRGQAVEEISNNFTKFYKIFTSNN